MLVANLYLHSDFREMTPNEQYKWNQIKHKSNTIWKANKLLLVSDIWVLCSVNLGLPISKFLAIAYLITSGITPPGYARPRAPRNTYFPLRVPVHHGHRPSPNAYL